MNWRPLREQLRLRRLELRLSLDDLADRASVNRSTIHKLENIKGFPNRTSDLDTIEKLASALNLDVSVSVMPLHEEIIDSHQKHVATTVKGDKYLPPSTTRSKKVETSDGEQNPTPLSRAQQLIADHVLRKLEREIANRTDLQSRSAIGDRTRPARPQRSKSHQRRSRS
jgi:transcriptional regulator with XRE-family HTH domain